MLVFGALLTAFYMTRQMAYVFWGHWRGGKSAHESPAVITVPLAMLAIFAIALGAIGTPAWPWFRAFLEGRAAGFNLSSLAEFDLLKLMCASAAVVLVGIGLGWKLYATRTLQSEEPDALERVAPLPWRWLRDRLYVDQLYEITIIAFYKLWARVADWFDRCIWGGLVAGVAVIFGWMAQLNRLLDANVVNGVFDKGCDELSVSGGLLSRVQTGHVQTYLRILALAVVALAAFLIWSSKA
jgi:NADH-quinone oxidoreductase subunit L